MFEPARDLILFVLVLGGLALPCAGWWRGFAPLERLALGLGAALVAVYLAAFGIYLTGAGWSWLWLAPAAGLAAGWRQRAELRAWLTEPDVRAALAGWLLLSLWCLGLQALIVSYSGGGWAGDWQEHYDRARFFVNRWPLDTVFIGFNPLPARPPLANLVTAGLLGLTGDAFARYQVFTTLLSTLVFFPLAALVRTGGTRPRALQLLTLLLMLNPLLVHNATFPWTKLPAAFFVLLAVVLLLHSLQQRRGHGWALGALAAGLLAHYSLGPWIIALGAAWFWLARRERAQAAWRRELVWGALGAAGLMATWFGWATCHYGPGLMINATSTVGLAPPATWTGRVVIALANIHHTLLPNWDSPILATLMEQPDFMSRLRDICFCLYQQNLPVALGLGNLGVLGWLAARHYTHSSARFWLLAVPLVVALGAAVHTWPVDLGLTHICLQPLVLLGLAWLAASAATVPGWLRGVWVVGLGADFLLGIALHFGLQSLLLPRLAHPGASVYELTGRFANMAMRNLGGKVRLGQPFLADTLAGHAGALLVLLAGLLLLAVVLWATPPRKMTSPVRSTPP